VGSCNLLSCGLNDGIESDEASCMLDRSKSLIPAYWLRVALARQLTAPFAGLEDRLSDAAKLSITAWLESEQGSSTKSILLNVHKAFFGSSLLSLGSAMGCIFRGVRTRTAWFVQLGSERVAAPCAELALDPATGS
jgi:hypothetical protein